MIPCVSCLEWAYAAMNREQWEQKYKPRRVEQRPSEDARVQFDQGAAAWLDRARAPGLMAPAEESPFSRRYQHLVQDAA